MFSQRSYLFFTGISNSNWLPLFAEGLYVNVDSYMFYWIFATKELMSHFVLSLHFIMCLD